MIIQTDKPMRERDPHDFYPTARWAVDAAVEEVLPLVVRTPERPIYVLDPGAGTGVWGESVHTADPAALIVGVEIRQDAIINPAYNAWMGQSFVPMPPAKKPEEYARKYLKRHTPERALELGREEADLAWYYHRMSVFSEDETYDLAIGNPPYNVAQEFVEKSMQSVRSHGVVAMLLRLAFLEGQKRAKEFYPKFTPYRVLTYSARPSFMPVGSGREGDTDSTAYGLFIWRKNAASRYYQGGWIHKPCSTPSS